jgi:hypothetical protein
MKDTRISERVYEYSSMHIRKERTSTKAEMDTQLPTETEFVWNIYTYVFIIERRGIICEV